MRELKFRAWDKYHKIFRSNSHIHVFIQDFENNTIFKMNHADNYNNKDRDYNNDRIIIQQYTGIKDANSNEVYEGDILQDDDGYIDIVKYHEEGYYHAGDWDGGDFTYCKVIGNIYENPELLENQK
jgi:hypothetical protein